MTIYRFQNSDKKIQIGKVVCLARTYAKHAEEMKSTIPEDPILFLKPESSIIFDNDSIVIPKMTSCVHHEVELGIVIGKDGKHIPLRSAMDHVLGYCVALDITARDMQSVYKQKGWPWSIAKGFDTFAPISSVVLKEKINDPHDLDIWLKVNGKLRQVSNTKYLIYTIDEIIEFVSSIMTLQPGDMIMTGTPEGVSEIKRGDKIEAKLGNICSLNVFVK